MEERDGCDVARVTWRHEGHGWIPLPCYLSARHRMSRLSDAAGGKGQGNRDAAPVSTPTHCCVFTSHTLIVCTGRVNTGKSHVSQAGRRL